MERVVTYNRQCQQLFLDGASSQFVRIVFCDAIALPVQQRIMEGVLCDEGSNPDTSQTYRVLYIANHLDRDSVFDDAIGSTIRVHAEDKVIWSTLRGQSSQVKAITSTETTKSSYATTYHGYDYTSYHHADVSCRRSINNLHNYRTIVFSMKYFFRIFLLEWALLRLVAESCLCAEWLYMG
jgi:hypothetical protein